MLDTVNLERQICDIVAECLGLDQSVSPLQTFKELGADSIDMATLIVTLQDEYAEHDSIDESLLAEIKTPADIIQLINALPAT